MSLNNKYCILKGIEGFGDRLQCLLQAIQYCEHTERILVIDWRDSNWQQDESDKIENYFLIENIKTESINSFLSKHSRSNSVTPNSWIDKISDCKYQKFLYRQKYSQADNKVYKLIINNQRGDFKEDIVVYPGIRFRSFIYKYFKYIKFNDHIIQKAKKTLEYESLKSFQYNCIHLRSQNKIWSGSPKIQKNLKERIHNKFPDRKSYFDFLFKKYKESNQGNKTILISDDLACSNYFNKEYFNGELINLTKKYNSHPGLCGIHKKVFELKKQKRMLNIDMLKDFYIMLQSKNIINDEISLFSNMAIFLKNDQP